MLTFDGQEAPDGHWYHAGYPPRGPEGPVPYRPTDPRAIDQRPYLAYLDKDATPAYQREEAR